MTAICTHLDQIRIEPPEAVPGCEDCLKIGGQWVHLRACRSCGHPIVSSLEPGEDWSWCYLDEVAFVVEPGA